MSGSELTLLAGLAVGTSALTAVIGLGGGIILLAAMLLFFEPLVAIPLHGVIQLVSNGSRVLIRWRDVRFDVLAPYALPLLPAAYLGWLVSRSLAPELGAAAIGVFVLVATWAPRWLLLGAHPESLAPRPRFFALGATVGLLSTSVGATGPVQGPFFGNLGLTRQGIVGTFAACQALSHVGKLVVFGSVGFGFLDHLPLLAVMCAGVVTGTWLGSRLLDRISERAFEIGYKVALTCVALHLIIEGAGHLLSAP
jgi:uncharacterized membrane protein YfcA